MKQPNLSQVTTMNQCRRAIGNGVGALTQAVLAGLFALACAADPQDDEALAETSEPLVQDNFCLAGSVPDAMRALKSSKGRIVKQLGNSGAGADFTFLDDHELSGCHVQSLVTLGSFGMVSGYNKVTRNNSFPATLLGNGCPEFDPAKLTPAKLMLNPFGFGFTSSISIPHPSRVFHPSGMASVGKLVFVAVDDGLNGGSPYFFVYDYTTTPPRLLQTLPLVALGMVDSVAASYEPSTQTYHVILNQNSQNRVVALTSVGSPSAFRLTQRMTTGNGRYPGKRNGNLNYQGMSLIRQCDGAMYLVGLSNNDYPDCAGNFDSCDDSVVDYARYDPTNFVVSAWQTIGALDNPCNGFLDFDICPNFAAGATLYVNDTQRLTAIATEHWPVGGDLDTLVWTQR